MNFLLADGRRKKRTYDASRQIFYEGTWEVSFVARYKNHRQAHDVFQREIEIEDSSKDERTL